MKKVIVLSAVLGMSALGMACGDSTANNANANKAANIVIPANNVTIAPASTPMTPASNAPVSNMKPANSTMAPASNMKPASTPMASPTKKP